MSLTLEVKKVLPLQGVKLLFMRAHAKDIANGRMDFDVNILNEKLELGAFSHHICFVVDNAHCHMKRAAPGAGKISARMAFVLSA